MNSKSMFFVFALAAVWTAVARIELLAQDADPVAAAQAATAALTEADAKVVAARNALQASRDSLNPQRFGSASWNARVSAEQVAATKDKYEKAPENEKNDALEIYELAQELAAQRANELKAAEEVLPQREADAKGAEEAYAVALAAADTAAEAIRGLVRQSQTEAATKLRESKLAIEHAAFTKATADQRTAANAAVSKTFVDLAAADAAVQAAAAAYQQAAEADRPARLAEAEAAVKAYVAALDVASRNMPEFRPDPSKPALLQLRIPLVEADRVLQSANAALQAAQADVQAKTDAIAQGEARVKSAQEGVANRVAKVRATKDLTREQEALARAVTAKAEAEKVLPERVAAAEAAQREYTAALQAAMETFVLTAAPQEAIAALKAAVAKAAADREAALLAENQALAAEATAAQAAADAAQAEWAATDKLLADRAAVRLALQKIQRQRFYRDANTAQLALRQIEAALTAARQALQARTNEWNQASANLKPAADNLAKAKVAVETHAGMLATATKDKETADAAVNEKTTAKTAAEQAAKDAQAALNAAQEALAAAAAEAKPAAEGVVKEKDAAVQAMAAKMKEAVDALTAAQTVQTNAAAALTAAQAKADELAKGMQAAEQAVAPLQTAVDATTAAKAAAEQVVNEQQQALSVAPIQVTQARAMAYGGLKPLPEEAWDLAKARHLLVRAGFGGTPDEVARLHALGLYAAVRELVYFKDRPAAEVAFAPAPKNRPEQFEAALTGEEPRLRAQQRVAADRQQMQNMRMWWLRRMVESPRPLEEKLTLFWHGQIPSSYSDVGDSYHMYLQNQLFREHAAGNFGALVHGVVHDAAMLKYLNADTNIKGRANENLARELMELFSMGRDQGYTEIDIRQAARALTGYTYDAWSGQFRFISDNHDTEPKTVLGKTGNWNGDDFARMILETPAPPKFIARQMFAFFAHDHPSMDTIEALASILQLNNYELTPMLENLFLSEEFYSAESMSTKIKSPVQMLVQLHRDLGLKNADYAYLAVATRDMGQELFEPPSVFGWQGGRAWITSSRILTRYNVLAETLERRPRAGQVGVDVVGTLLAGKQFQNHTEVVDYLARSFWAVPLTDGKRQAMLEFLKALPEPAQWAADPGPANAALTRLLVMLMCAPEYQLT